MGWKAKKETIFAQLRDSAALLDLQIAAKKRANEVAEAEAAAEVSASPWDGDLHEGVIALGVLKKMHNLLANSAEKTAKEFFTAPAVETEPETATNRNSSKWSLERQFSTNSYSTTTDSQKPEVVPAQRNWRKLAALKSEYWKILEQYDELLEPETPANRSASCTPRPRSRQTKPQIVKVRRVTLQAALGLDSNPCSQADGDT